MKDFPIHPELVVRNGSERPLRSIAEARSFIRELVKQRPDESWRAMLRRLKAVKTEQDATAAANALREMLEADQLLIAEVDQR
jgi:hypothetical protein